MSEPVNRYPWRDPAWVEQQGLEGVLLADGFDDALIGFGTHFNTPVAIYDWHKCVDMLYQQAVEACTDQEECDHMSEAIEFMDFNTTGAWVGEGTPVFLRVRVNDSEAAGEHCAIPADEEEA